jgi:hypothetical protein
MASCDPFRQNHKRFIIDTLLDEYSDISDENFFLTIGKITPWGATAGSDIPVASIDSVEDETNFWRGLIAAKRINRSDVSLVVRRVDWAAGTAYQPYRDNIDLFDDVNPANFYALVDEEKVYVCIDNNGGSPSLNPPSHTDSVVRKLADGYRWKFLYSIPESKRKFLTKTRAGAVGYMPIEFVESLRTNDDRTLQWNIQQAAVNGKIEFAYLDEAARAYWVTTASCLLPSSANLVLASVPVGATTIQISSPILNPDKTLYTGMVLSIDSGAGQGQRRVIKDFFPLGATTNGGVANVFVDPLVLGLSGTEDANKQSYFSIQPKVAVEGDGRAYANTNNPTTTTAEFLVKFGATASGVDACSSFTPRFISSIEVVDGGRDYTFAELSIPKGLTTLPDAPIEFRSLNEYLHAVIPPTGGHGSNAPRELGAASFMIVKEYNRDEEGQVDTENDFRQFGILRNPLLSEKQLRIKFFQPGLSGSFVVGATAAELGGAIGNVLEWCPGITGVTATSELVLGNIRGGTFAAGGTMNSLTIFDVAPKTVAGSEGRHLLKLTLLPNNGEFDSSGGTYKRLHFAHGVGNRITNIPQSRSSGEVYCWEPAAGTNSYGFLCLENPKGNFTIGENVLQTQPYFSGSNGSTGAGRISAITTELQNMPPTYDLTTMVKVQGENFSNDTFLRDLRVSLVQGLTSAYGYVIDWNPATGGTNGDLRIGGVQGTVLTGQSLSYVAFGASGTTSTVNGTVAEIEHLSELKYRSGEVLYIQNIKPIMRDIEQREEIKLVIEL